MVDWALKTNYLPSYLVHLKPHTNLGELWSTPPLVPRAPLVHQPCKGHDLSAQPIPVCVLL